MTSNEAKLILEGDSELDSEFSTNEVLQEDKRTRSVVYLPCYVRFKVKEISKIDIEGLSGVVSGTLLFTFYYGTVERAIIDRFVGGDNAILLNFSHQQSILLKEDKGITMKEDHREKTVEFVVRMDFNCQLEGDVFYTPFEIINLYLTVTVQTLVLNPRRTEEHQHEKRVDVKFNVMRSSEVMMLGWGEKCNFASYQLAHYFLDSRYTNSPKNPFKPISVLHGVESEEQYQARKKHSKKQVHSKKMKHGMSVGDPEMFNEVHELSTNQISVNKKTSMEEDNSGEADNKAKNFQYVHYRIPLYKYPGANLLSIFLPLWVLGFINLLIFFQDNRLADRIAVIATLTLAFIAFIPTINEQIPETPYVKLVEILVYIETAANILCLVQSVVIRNQDNLTYQIAWKQDAFFIAAVILNLITVVVVLMLFVLHKCWWERIYTREANQHKMKKTLDRRLWNNAECDQEFKEWIKSGKIRVL